MVSEFLVYLRLGFEHIADPRGYDHILFIVALTAMYTARQWRQVIILVTAFTLGHSLTLALATLELVRVSTAWVEFLIPVTILVTALLQIRWLWDDGEEEGPAASAAPAHSGTTYLLALGFGLIHGLGFSNFLRAALGAEASITLPLLAFNVGLEVGQIFIVLLVLAATAVVTGLLRAPRREWITTLCGATAAVAVYLASQRIPF